MLSTYHGRRYPDQLVRPPGDRQNDPVSIK